MQRLNLIKALCTLICLGPPAIAGPWMREDGTRFLSTAGTLSYTPDTLLLEQGYDIYFEAGHSPTLTYGAEISGTAQSNISLLGFVQKPIGDPAKPLKMSYQIGIGATQNQGIWSPILKGALHLGKGTQNGWMSMETSYQFDTGAGTSLAKVSGTLGRNHSDRLKAMLHIRVDKATDSTAGIALAPALAWEMRQGQHLTAEIEARHSDTTRYGVKLGIWRDF